MRKIIKRVVDFDTIFLEIKIVKCIII